MLVVRDLVAPASDLHALAGLALWATVGWSLLNLVPVLPLDGGRAATAALSLLAGRDVEVLVGAASVVLGSAVAVITATHGFLGLAAVAVGIAAVNAVAVAPPARPGGPGRPSQGQRARSPAASRSASQTISSAWMLEAGAVGSPAATRDSASRLDSPDTVTSTSRARAMPA